MLKDFHHFKGNNLTRSEKIQRLVTQLLLRTNITDEKRESSIVWELKHHAGCVQIGRIIAQKRKLNVELAEIICALHDIYVIVEGSYKDHAMRGGSMAKKILLDSGDFTPKEVDTIVYAIRHHSEKEIYTDKPYVELAKDADVFECSLYQGAEGFYRLHKSEPIFTEYVNRIKNVRKELGLDPGDVFRK